MQCVVKEFLSYVITQSYHNNLFKLLVLYFLGNIAQVICVSVQ